jgi:DNA-binding MarR family transcriptional regulator
MENEHSDTTPLDDVAFGLFRLGLHIVRSERSLGAGKGILRIPKLSALAAVVDKRSIPVDKLAQVEGVREPTISATLQVLEADKLVELDRDSEDKRVWNAQPTKKAERQLNQGKKRLATVLADAGVDKAQAAKLEDAVNTIAAVLRDFKDTQEKRRQGKQPRRTARRGKS